MRNKPLPGMMKKSPIKQKPEGFNWTGSKEAKRRWTFDKFQSQKQKAKKFVKGLKKAGKFVGGKTLGVAGMLMGTTSKADQPKKGKGSYTSDITKMKGYKK